VEDAFIPKFGFSFTLVAALVALPLLASLLTMLTARRTVTSALGRMV